MLGEIFDLQTLLGERPGTFRDSDSDWVEGEGVKIRSKVLGYLREPFSP